MVGLDLFVFAMRSFNFKSFLADVTAFELFVRKFLEFSFLVVMRGSFSLRIRKIKEEQNKREPKTELKNIPSFPNSEIKIKESRDVHMYFKL